MYRTRELFDLLSAERANFPTAACQCPGASFWLFFYGSPRFYNMSGTLRYIAVIPHRP